MFVPEGAQAARIEVQARPGRAGSSDFVSLGSNPLSGENTAYLASRVAPKVSGIIRNRLGQDVSDISVSAVLYDGSGAIIGGGSTYLEFVPANGTAAVEVYVTSKGTPARIDLYPALTILSDIGR